jgi:hypothetical protein
VRANKIIENSDTLRFSLSPCLLVSLSALTAALAGCGGGASVPSRGSEDGRQIAVLIGNFNDDVSSSKRMTASFAKGAMSTKAADVKRYGNYMYEVVGAPSVSGDTATAKVKMRENRSGDTHGPLEWTFVKEGDAWKIKSAPLP